MIFKPFNTTEDFFSLIEFGKTTESLHLDFKAVLNTSKAEETAIDLAAFANTFGGTLLIGISEKKNELGYKVAHSLCPVEDAEVIKRHLHCTVLNYIRPTVKMETVVLQIESKIVVAVNVEPSVDLVGVCLNIEREAYCFPYRIEFGNRYFNFFEVEERMSESFSRRNFIKLCRFLPNTDYTQKVRVYPIPFNSKKDDTWSIQLVEDSTNEFTLHRNSTTNIRLPYSMINDMWQVHPGDNGIIGVRLTERLVIDSEGRIDFDDAELRAHLMRIREKKNELIRNMLGGKR